MPESLRTGPGDPFTDGRIRAYAAHWARRLRISGFSDVDADDLVQEAARLAHARLSTGEIGNPVAFVRTVVRNAALMRLRHPPELASDPTQLRLSSLAADGRPHDELEARMHLADTLRYLERNWDEIWAGAVRAFGRTERAPESIRAASVRAIEHLVLQDTGLDIDEILRDSMAAADPFWRADGELGVPITTLMERRRKRLARDLHWISYVVLYRVLRWAYADNPRAARHLAGHHLRHLRITAQESRSESARAALEPHIAEVTRAAGG